MRKSLIVVLVALGLWGQALAQPADPLRSGVERRVTAGIAIPFGPRGRTETPQLQLRGSTISRGDTALTASERDRWQPRRERSTRIGFTLERSPQLTLDGREPGPNDDRRGLSTLGYVAIGVGVAAVVGGVLLLERINAASD
jgi:hypothetical protein